MCYPNNLLTMVHTGYVCIPATRTVESSVTKCVRVLDISARRSQSTYFTERTLSGVQCARYCMYVLPHAGAVVQTHRNTSRGE